MTNGIAETIARRLRVLDDAVNAAHMRAARLQRGGMSQIRAEIERGQLTDETVVRQRCAALKDVVCPHWKSTWELEKGQAFERQKLEGLAKAVAVVTEDWPYFRDSGRRNGVEHLKVAYMLEGAAERLALATARLLAPDDNAYAMAAENRNPLLVDALAFQLSLQMNAPLLALSWAYSTANTLNIYDELDIGEHLRQWWNQWHDGEPAFQTLVEDIRGQLPALSLTGSATLPDELTVPEILALPQFQSADAIGRRHLYGLAERGKIESRVLPDGQRLCRVESALTYRRRRSRR